MTASKHAVIYVFGLSDHRAKGQTLAVKLWRIYGVSPEVFHMYWNVPEPLEDKLSKLLARIDELTGEGYIISLVGTSAGASATMAAYAARPQAIRAVVCICGKLRSPDTIHPSTYRRNTAFQESMAVLQGNLTMLDASHRDRILSIRPRADHLVPPSDTIIPGAHTKQVPTIGHAFTIGFCITLYAPFILRFIKRTASR